MTSIEFHARLKALAKRRNKKLIDIENNTGLKKGTIKNWKRYIPGADKLVMLAGELETSVDYLLGITDYDLPVKALHSASANIILNALVDHELSEASAQAVASVITALRDRD